MNNKNYSRKRKQTNCEIQEDKQNCLKKKETESTEQSDNSLKKCWKEKRQVTETKVKEERESSLMKGAKRKTKTN